MVARLVHIPQTASNLRLRRRDVCGLGILLEPRGARVRQGGLSLPHLRPRHGDGFGGTPGLKFVQLRLRRPDPGLGGVVLALRLIQILVSHQSLRVEILVAVQVLLGQPRRRLRLLEPLARLRA